ncbi:hypothetical protein RND71_009016 [Anisodus tanguticus]|uniref:Cystatin domain-containing protein n=1 Tax=Anisodus tanguticus TaxID=243964 RepID=A0AAE1SPF7_9SOLA|nr:hypothetical protein RND71_009016 [Anisodus tanguticus]
MAIKFNPIFWTFLVVVATILFHTSAVHGSRKEALVGGWKPITNLTDPVVVGIGQFAVDEHNLHAMTKLKFQQVTKGESQVVAGINYRVTITAEDGDSPPPHHYLAVVLDKPQQKYRNLTSFRDLGCSDEKGEQKCSYV